MVHVLRDYPPHVGRLAATRSSSPVARCLDGSSPGPRPTASPLVPRVLSCRSQSRSSFSEWLGWHRWSRLGVPESDQLAHVFRHLGRHRVRIPIRVAQVGERQDVAGDRLGVLSNDGGLSRDWIAVAPPGANGGTPEDGPCSAGSPATCWRFAMTRGANSDLSVSRRTFTSATSHAPLTRRVLLRNTMNGQLFTGACGWHRWSRLGVPVGRHLHRAVRDLGRHRVRVPVRPLSSGSARMSGTTAYMKSSMAARTTFSSDVASLNNSRKVASSTPGSTTSQVRVLFP